MYQIQYVQIVFKYKTLHGSLEICKYSQGFRRGERRGKGGSTKLGWTIQLLWMNRDIKGGLLLKG